MSEATPAALESKIAGVAAALGLVRPEIKELSGGASNRSFRMRDGKHDVVLRLAGVAAPVLGSDLPSEAAMQTLAAGAGLAPLPVFVDAARGVVVSQYVAGHVPTALEIREARMTRRIGAFMARLHALEPPPGLPVVDFSERAAGYLERLLADCRDSFVERLWRELARRRSDLPSPARLAACHHDLHHRNFIDGGAALVAVDWEYAGPGDPAADLAACIGYNALEAGPAGALFEGYGAAGAELRARVEALGWIFDCLWFGWNALAAQGGLRTDPAEQALLAARLGA